MSLIWVPFASLSYRPTPLLWASVDLNIGHFCLIFPLGQFTLDSPLARRHIKGECLQCPKTGKVIDIQKNLKTLFTRKYPEIEKHNNLNKVT